MSTVNEAMEEVEEEPQYIMVDVKPVPIRRVIDSLLGKEEKRRFSEG